MGIKDKHKAAACATAARLLAMKAQVENQALNDVKILENNAKTSACEGGGFSTLEAQIQVKTFSSCKYKSHRRIPDTVARAVDAV